MIARPPAVSPARWVPTAYFAEGLPFVAIAMVSSLMYKNMGIADAAITFWTSLVMLPWTLKPLWGPVMEMFKTKKHFVVGTELLGGVAFGLLALSLPLEEFFRYSLALFAIIAFNGATHDIAADGLYINVLSDKLQAQFVGWQGASYNIAKIFTQGALVFLAGQLEVALGVVHAWMIVMGVFGAILVLISLYHLRVLPAGDAASKVSSLGAGFATLWDVVRSFFRKKHIVWGIVFIILYRFAEGQAIKIVPLFFRAAREQGGLGLTTSEIGIVYGTFGAAAFVLGSILAGYFTAGRGLAHADQMLDRVRADYEPEARYYRDAAAPRRFKSTRQTAGSGGGLDEVPDEVGQRHCGAVDVAVIVNGTLAGHVPWEAANGVDITRYLTPGDNSVDIEVVSSPRNMLGPLHLAAGRPSALRTGSGSRTATAIPHACSPV